MRKLLLLSLFFGIKANSQSIVTVDSTAVAFKAKLFTVSEYGIADKVVILQDIEQQHVEFLKTSYQNFIFLKVYFSQPYREPPNYITTLIRDCYYYLAFNIIDSKFYRLGGFDNLDIDDFFKDLEKRELRFLFKFEEQEVEEIDIFCLYDYFTLSNKKRRKSKFTCFENCGDDTQTEFIDR